MPSLEMTYAVKNTEYVYNPLTGHGAYVLITPKASIRDLYKMFYLANSKAGKLARIKLQPFFC